MQDANVDLRGVVRPEHPCPEDRERDGCEERRRRCIWPPGTGDDGYHPDTAQISLRRRAASAPAAVR